MKHMATKSKGSQNSSPFSRVEGSILILVKNQTNIAILNWNEKVNDGEGNYTSDEDEPSGDNGNEGRIITERMKKEHRIL